MALKESSKLLKNDCERQYTSDYNHNIDGYHTIDSNNHIVYVNKDVSDYEPIFCLNEYSSSLTIDELLPYKLDPWWQNLRRILFLTFWLIFLMTFLTACLLSYTHYGQETCNTASKTTTTSAAAKVLLTELLTVP